jgi:hypothetical protein
MCKTAVQWLWDEVFLKKNNGIDTVEDLTKHFAYAQEMCKAQIKNAYHDGASTYLIKNINDDYGIFTDAEKHYQLNYGEQP